MRPSSPRPSTVWTHVAAYALLALSLLTLVPAPAYAISALALAITEWAHLGAVVALLLMLWLGAGPSRPGSHRLALAAAAMGVCIFSAPVIRAALVARDLRDQLSARFGGLEPVHQPIGSPLNVATLFRAASSSSFRRDTMTYASREGEDLSMDVFRDRSTGRRQPAIIVVHGGSWQGGTRAEFRALNEYLATKGRLVASIDYRLAPRWRFPAALDDVRAAIAFVKTHAEELDADPGRIVLLGRSAGTQLALLAAYANPDPSVRGVVALYGPADMRFAYEHPNNPWILDSPATLRAYLGGSPAEVPAAYDAASPIAYVSASTPPTLLIHGSRDQLVQEAQSARLDARLTQAGRAHFFLRLPWGTHACDYNFTGPCGQISTYAIDYFLNVVFQ